MIDSTINHALKDNIRLLYTQYRQMNNDDVDQLALCYNMNILSKHMNLFDNRKYITNLLRLSCYSNLTTHIFHARRLLYHNGDL